ncbi:MAG: signal peptidase I [Clostridium sp.]|uniref:signal peptidase I n=1 Tax=Clostridium sp. TaxID=1506 RepID=UPI0025BE0DDF|nr:signal peptidase I [Clostridium sp.]MCF0148659.1 signal peptidase I [Clostridium sp.]
MKGKMIFKEIRGAIIIIIGSIMLVSIINTKVFAMAKVQQKSMENTLYSDEKLFVDKLSYNFSKPERGDIIIFLKDEEKGNVLSESYKYIKEVISFKIFNDNRTRYVKRIIGIEGDEINITSGYVYINGEKLNETYIKGETYNRDIDFPIVVGKNQYFVLGDNREVSKDSRDFGLININQIEGKATFRIFPLEKFGAVK